MHILILKSFTSELRSHADAWQTTFRSCGFMNNDLSQKVSDKGSNPSEIKKFSAILTISISSMPFSMSMLVKLMSEEDELLSGV